MDDLDFSFNFEPFIEETVKREEEAKEKAKTRREENDINRQQQLRFRDRAGNKIRFKK